MALSRAAADHACRAQDDFAWAPLSRSSRFALYRQIADRLREAIQAGATRLPTERQLAARFSVARVTVRRALDVLVGEQLISRRRRLGTLVQQESAASWRPRS